MNRLLARCHWWMNGRADGMMEAYPDVAPILRTMANLITSICAPFVGLALLGNVAGQWRVRRARSRVTPGQRDRHHETEA